MDQFHGITMLRFNGNRFLKCLLGLMHINGMPDVWHSRYYLFMTALFLPYYHALSLILLVVSQNADSGGRQPPTVVKWNKKTRGTVTPSNRGFCNLLRVITLFVRRKSRLNKQACYTTRTSIVPVDACVSRTRDKSGENYSEEKKNCNSR